MNEEFFRYGYYKITIALFYLCGLIVEACRGASERWIFINRVGQAKYTAQLK
jgi:hypothetical protein